MEFIKYILSRALPKTGQVTEYEAGDDGTYEAGWWLKRLNANNRARFVAKTIGGDKVVFDKVTGLMWAADGNEAGCNDGAEISWAGGIAYALALDFAGFTDWRVPNAKELMSIVTYVRVTPALLEPPFINTGIALYWSSTTYSAATSAAWQGEFDTGALTLAIKTDTELIRCVRGGI